RASMGKVRFSACFMTNLLEKVVFRPAVVEFRTGERNFYTAEQIKDCCRARCSAAAKSGVELNPRDDVGVWDFNATLLRMTRASGLCEALDEGGKAACST